MTEEKNWGDSEWRAPTLEEGDELLYSECGRVVQRGTYGHGDSYGIDYRSHYFRIVKRKYGGCWLLVHHGGGQERFFLEHSRARLALFFDRLDSTERYLLMHLFFTIHKEASRESAQTTSSNYQKAFVEGRLKKRKARNSDSVKVWIESGGN